MPTFWKRLTTAVILIPLIIWCIYVGGGIFFFIVFLVTAGALMESGLLLRHNAVSVNWSLLFSGGLLFPIAAWFLGASYLLPLIFLIIICVFLQEFLRPMGQPLTRGGAHLLVILYGGFLPSHFILLRLQAQGFYLLFLVFLATWVTDTGAYLVGSRWGRHKLVPHISPRKSWEGAIGGLILAVIVMAYARNFLPVDLPSGWLVGLLISVAAQLGDLVESAMKREAGVKDSGWILPGHGGILDRIDSLLLAVPLFYYFVQWLG